MISSTRSFLCTTLPWIACLIAHAATAQDAHGHLNAGATGQAQGDRLTFANGNIFSSESGYVKELPLASSGKYSGYYAANITFTALATTIDNGGPVAGAPAPGSFIMAGIQSVEGPAGGRFGFWDSAATAPTIEYSVGYEATTPTSLWSLSDASIGAGAQGADPFGHIHGRSFTATMPGDYTVSFQLFDLSIHGAGGGPIHTPSELLSIRFTAVPEPSTAALILVGGLIVAAGLRPRP
jgi:hypothetical protein